jgi:hypothetical protein
MSRLLSTAVLTSIVLASACTTIVPPSGGEPSVDAGGQRADELGETPDAGPAPDATPVFDSCEQGDANFEAADGTCYMYFFQSSDWAGARARCNLVGGDLARIDDDVTNGILASLVPTAFPEVWLLGTDEQTEGLWTWGGSDPLSFAKWRSGEPNNGNGGPAENCMIMQSNQGGAWDDRACNEQFSYLCQR